MERINKATARKMWNAGKPFYAVACKLSPMAAAVIARPDVQKWTFETWYNNFCYYHCNSRTGNYVHFYILTMDN